MTYQTQKGGGRCVAVPTPRRFQELAPGIVSAIGRVPSPGRGHFGVQCARSIRGSLTAHRRRHKGGFPPPVVGEFGRGGP